MPVSSRNGVKVRLASRNRSAQSPSVSVMKSMGFAVRSSVQNQYSRHASGSRHATHTTLLMAMRPDLPTRALPRLVGLLEVHPGVERGHLIAVAVEGQRGATAELADAALGRLAPARMIHGGI